MGVVILMVLGLAGVGLAEPDGPECARYSLQVRFLLFIN
jgi:hypothetical protein